MSRVSVQCLGEAQSTQIHWREQMNTSWHINTHGQKNVVKKKRRAR
jgi:hypothetical protein